MKSRSFVKLRVLVIMLLTSVLISGHMFSVVYAQEDLEDSTSHTEISEK